jgi:hypothetical protein
MALPSTLAVWFYLVIESKLTELDKPSKICFTLRIGKLFNEKIIQKKTQKIFITLCQVLRFADQYFEEH